jgi:hypothetical protein
MTPLDDLARAIEREQAGELDAAQATFERLDREAEPQGALGLGRIAGARGDDALAQWWNERAGDLELARRMSVAWWMVRPAEDMSEQEVGFAADALRRRIADLRERTEVDAVSALELQVAAAETRFLLRVISALEGVANEETESGPRADATAPSGGAGGHFVDDDRPGYMTVLGDAYLVEARRGRYEVIGTASGTTVCRVPTAVAEEALAEHNAPVRLGTWPVVFRGVADAWNIWHALDVIWLSGSDVSNAAHAAALMERFCAESEAAETAGTAYDPDPPARVGDVPPATLQQTPLEAAFVSGLTSGAAAGAKRLFRRRR